MTSPSGSPQFTGTDNIPHSAPTGAGSPSEDEFSHSPHSIGDPGGGTATTPRPSTRFVQPATSNINAVTWTPIFRLMAPHAAMTAHPRWLGGYRVALSNSSRAALKSSAMSHRSGSNSGHDTIPTSSLPVNDITVMLSPEPWKIGPSGYMASTSQPR